MTLYTLYPRMTDSNDQVRANLETEPSIVERFHYNTNSIRQKVWRYLKDTENETDIQSEQTGESKHSSSLEERTLRAAKATRRVIAEKAERLCYQAVRVCFVFKYHSNLTQIPYQPFLRSERVSMRREKFWTNETSTTRIQR